MKAVLLMSTGIDSPVAAHILRNQGVELVLAHMYSNESTVEVASELRNILDPKIPLYAVPVQGIHKLLNNLDQKFHCIFCKRMMYRIACGIAERGGGQAIATGESLGQVASQTLENLAVLTEASNLPVLRPLIAHDKEDTIRLSKRAGLYETSIKHNPHCQYLPKKPATKSQPDYIRGQEGRIDYRSAIEKALAEAKRI